MPLLTARTLITAIGAIAYPAITIGPTGLIEDISTDASIQSDRILTPTFLDIHIHGAAGEDVMSANPAGLARIGRFLAGRGTSHYLPTTATAPLDITLRALDQLGQAIARPTPLKLLDYISHLAFDKSVLTIMIAVFFIASIYLWLSVVRRKPQPAPLLKPENLGLIGFAAAFIPFLTYAFTAVVTHVFNERYIVSATLALSVAVALLVRHLRWPKSLELLLLIFVILVYAKDVLPNLRHPAGTTDSFETAIAALPGNDPVAMPDGGSFFRSQVSADPAVRARTVYLFLPGAQLDPDTEPSRIAHAWHTLRPELPIYNSEAFFAQHKSFYILTWSTPGGGLIPYVKANMHTEIVSVDADRIILHVTHD